MNGIVFALLVPVFTGLALVLQRRAHIKFNLRNVFKSRLWLSGMFLDIVGFLLYAMALSLERISIVQPLMALSLAVTAVVERLVRQSKNNALDYMAVLLIIIGIVLVI